MCIEECIICIKIGIIGLSWSDHINVNYNNDGPSTEPCGAPLAIKRQVVLKTSGQIVCSCLSCTS